MPDDELQSQEVDTRINSVAAEMERRLSTSLDDDGKIDLDKLGTEDQALHRVLEAYAMAKSWRDDPKITARDVARLLEAQSRTTPLGSALESLEATFEA